MESLDRLGGWALIYEGVCLGFRRAGIPTPPVISEAVWRLPRPLRAVVGAGVCGYLFHHFVTGPRTKPEPLSNPT